MDILTRLVILMYNIRIENRNNITEYEEYFKAGNQTVYWKILLDIGEFSVLFSLYILLLITATEYWGNLTPNLS